MNGWLAYLGTYTRTGPSRGIYAVRLEAATGALGTPELVAEAPDPGWLALTPDGRTLLAAQPTPAHAAAFSIDPATGRLAPGRVAPPASPVSGPSHLAVDPSGRLLLAAHYHQGHVAAIPLGPGGVPGAPVLLRHEGRSVHATRQDGAHPHSVTCSPDGRHAIVADLGLDRILTYALTPGRDGLMPAPVSAVSVEPGAGPRHAKFSVDGRWLHVINELNNTIATFAYTAATGRLAPQGRVSTLPAGWSGASTAAELRVHPGGRFVYASNRGHDSLAVFQQHPVTGALRPVQQVPSGGAHPRNFDLSPDGRWLLCGHQNSPELTVFGINPADGHLTPGPPGGALATCVCVLFAPTPLHNAGF